MEFVDGLIALSDPVKPHFSMASSNCTIRANELVLEAAINGRAAAIVTFNVKDLLPAERSFGISVIRPGDALKRIQP